MRRGWQVRRRILLLELFLAALRLFKESSRVKLPGEVLDGRGDARGGAIYGVADHRKAAIADGLHDAPSGKRSEHFDGGGSGVGMRSRENQEFGLQPGDFFQTNLRPALLGIHEGDRPRPSQSIPDESFFSTPHNLLTP